MRGTGRVVLAAYGLADAEHQVEKELTRLCPGARVQVLEVARAGDPRIVEEFTIHYRLDHVVRVEVAAAEEAPRAAFRQARGLLAGSRYARTEWSAP